MRNFWRFASRSVYIPFLYKAQETSWALRSSGRALFLFFVGLLIVSTLGLLYTLNSSIITPVPSYGGVLREGIVGSPRFVNPVLAVSDADHDTVSLIYSGLLRATPEGEYVPELASSWEVSNDGRVYTFSLREGSLFHDNTPVTTEDIVFTVAKAQNPAIKSPLRANWEGVVVEEVDERTVRFTLRSSYAPFIENLTMGILPKHLWEGVSDEEFPFSDLNTSPIGSGAFRVASISRSSAGIPTSFELRSFANSPQRTPYLSKIVLNFYQNEEALVEALKRAEVEAASSLSPSSVEKLQGFNIERSPLNRVFGVFFNQNQSQVLRDRDVREALKIAVDRNALVEEVLGGFGIPLESPVPPTIVNTPLSTLTVRTESGDLAERARQELINAGWEPGADGILTKEEEDEETMRLSFILSTGNVPELKVAASFLKETWERMGAEVELQVFDQGDLSQNVIRPRKYDALLFGEVVGRALDLYAFWHSSQRNDPGLNIALYANSTADGALEELRTTRSEEARVALYKKFEGELKADLPAIFLYAPDFVYSVPNDITGIDLGFIGRPSDRFLSIRDWHREKDYVWPFFVPDRTATNQ